MTARMSYAARALRQGGSAMGERTVAHDRCADLCLVGANRLRQSRDRRINAVRVGQVDVGECNGAAVDQIANRRDQLGHRTRHVRHRHNRNVVGAGDRHEAALPLAPAWRRPRPYSQPPGAPLPMQNRQSNSF
jgi:hypothetical protein